MLAQSHWLLMKLQNYSIASIFFNWTRHERLLVHSGLRRVQTVNGISHPRRSVLLEQAPDGSQAKLSSPTVGAAYLEALDQYIDYDWDGNLRKCLLDKNGKRLLDSNGSPKTLRHKFAVYCDDIAA